MSLTKEEIQIRQKLKDDFQHYAEKCLRIRTKEGAIKPLILNSAQKYLHQRIEEQREKTGKVRAILLKGRQQGCSTYVEGRYYWRCTHRKGVRVFVLTHEQDATNNLFEMAHRFHIHCPSIVKPSTGASNAKELHFDKLDSGYKVGTAGTKGVGRSSTIQYLHGSEAAFWPNAEEHARGVMQAVADTDDTEIIIESTADGVGNWFHQQWQLAEIGESDYIPIFIPWFWQTEYRSKVPENFVLTEIEIELKENHNLDDEQLAWRRKKIIELTSATTDGEIAFKREYPCTPVEAFVMSTQSSLISPEIVEKARHSYAERYGPLLVGMDPARFGKDRTAIIFRQGRVAFARRLYSKKDTMELVGIAHRIIQKYKPNKFFIDVGGLGAGIVDRLHELGYRDIVRGVNGAEKAMESDRYYNKRSEMWGEMLAWLKDTPVQIPDSDSLAADLCGPQATEDSKSRTKLEKKEDMMKRGIRSPDEGDALALTFAEPVAMADRDQEISYIPADDVVGF